MTNVFSGWTAKAQTSEVEKGGSGQIASDTKEVIADEPIISRAEVDLLLSNMPHVNRSDPNCIVVGDPGQVVTTIARLTDGSDQVIVMDGINLPKVYRTVPEA